MASPLLTTPTAMEKRALGPTHSAPYGQACSTCFKAKSRCVARPDGDGCQRCHRLKRDCYPSDVLRQRVTDAKQKEKARIMELEGKLEALVSVLESRQTPDGNGVTQQPNATAASDFEARELLNEEAEYRLDAFRSSMRWHFGFVHVPSHQTVPTLQHERPLFFSAILAVTSLSAHERDVRGRELKRRLFEAPPGIDALLGLLLYIAWGWEHVRNRCSLSRLMMQAMALVGEMRLNKPMPDTEMAHFCPGTETWDTERSCMPAQQLFLERQRALLGCFLLSSVVSDSGGEIDALGWTPLMDEALAAVTLNKECRTDVKFALMVRMQLLVEKSIQICKQQQENSIRTAETTAPAISSLDALKKELHEIRASFPYEFEDDKIIAAYGAYVELRISDATFTVLKMVPMMVKHFSAVVSQSHSALAGFGTTRSAHCTSYPWQSVDAIKACTSAWLSIESLVWSLSFIQWTQITQCVVSLNQIMAQRLPNFEPTSVRSVIDITVLVDDIAGKLELAAVEEDEVGSGDVFVQLAAMMRSFHRETGVRQLEEPNGLFLQSYSIRDLPGDERSSG